MRERARERRGARERRSDRDQPTKQEERERGPRESERATKDHREERARGDKCPFFLVHFHAAGCWCRCLLAVALKSHMLYINAEC